MQDILAQGLGILWGETVRIEIGMPILSVASVAGGSSLIAVVLFSRTIDLAQALDESSGLGRLRRWLTVSRNDVAAVATQRDLMAGAKRSG
jgi:hypothetical protein